MNTWQWASLAGLGAFHGLNPAMGWLFAVALGLHRKSRGVVLASLLPIALGHGLSVALVAGLLVATGLIVPITPVRIAAGVILIAWAIYHWRVGHLRRVRVGMQTGLVGLGLWSFTMATAHGAGLMLWPVLMPLCYDAAAGATSTEIALATALAGVGVHLTAMLIVTAVVAILVFEWAGLGFLRRAWVNVDAIWSAALIATGTLLLVW